MNITRRRALLGATILAAGPLGLAGCGGVAMTPAQIVTTAGTIAQGLAGAIKQIEHADPSLIPADVAAQIDQFLTLAQGAASSLSGNLPAEQGANTVKTIEGYINAVLATLAAPPINGLIPAPFNVAIAAAAVLLPQLEAFVASVIPAAAASSAALKARDSFTAQAPGLTWDGAVAVLRGYEPS